MDSNKKIRKPIEGFNNKGRTAWNKGLTSDDPRIQKRLETFRKNKELGLHKDTSGKNNVNSRPEVRLKKSINKKIWLKENPDRVPYLLNHSSKISYPEKYFLELFEKENINVQYHKQYSKYQLDFCNEEYKIDIEIDGNQHVSDPKTVKIDIERDRYFEERGWQIIRINWSVYQKKSKEEKIKLIDDIRKKLSC